MNWQDVCDDPTLQDLPYKIELNRYGQIVMSPASNERGRYQTRVAAALLELMEGGEVITECSIKTEDGVKVADVAWGSGEFFARHGLATPLPEAPQICVEIISPGNSEAEMQEKRGLYFAAGALEVWFLQPNGRLEFHDASAQLNASRLAPTFPREFGR